jgi:hypothetical protein
VQDRRIQAGQHAALLRHRPKSGGIAAVGQGDHRGDRRFEAQIAEAHEQVNHLAAGLPELVQPGLDGLSGLVHRASHGRSLFREQVEDGGGPGARVNPAEIQACDHDGEFVGERQDALKVRRRGRSGREAGEGCERCQQNKEKKLDAFHGSTPG